MADVRPFHGIRYALSVVGDMTDVVCPPYDIISLDEEKSLIEGSSYNAVQIELRQEQPGEAHDDTRYDRAASLFRRWIDESVLNSEQSPAMYLVEEEFTHDGRAMRRQGLMVVVRLEEFDKGIVLPHEFTRPGPKVDRLALMNAGRANFSPLMSLYRDSDGFIAKMLEQVRSQPPDVITKPNGQPEIKMRIITDSNLLVGLSEELNAGQIFVADGHHRYETALQYRDELEASEGALSTDAASKFVMMTLISMDDPGLLVLPYHRIMSGLSDEELASLKRQLEQAFSIEGFDVLEASAEATAKALEDRLAREPSDEVVVVAVGLEPGKAHLLTLRDAFKPAPEAPSLERCDMWLLHEHGIRSAIGEQREEQTVVFVHDSIEAVESVMNGNSQIAFLLRALPMDLFEDVVGKGERLPSKSTYFYPKLPTGLVFNDLVGEL